jgi:glycosyltransferase involved in cell wall biosynthesis
MSNQRPYVSIIVPCRNERRHIDACLKSVLDQIEPPGGFEVLVADGMSDDGTREIIAEFALRDPRVRMIDNPLRTTSPGLNQAILAARGEIIVRVDAHTEYAPDYVQQCVAVMNATGADNVGGAARTRGEGKLQRAVCAAFHSPFSTGGAGFHQPDFEGEVDTVVYGCWKRERLIAIGMFDEKLVRNQDDELNFRIKRAGGRLWQSRSIRSWYRPRTSLRALFRQYLQYGYWKVGVMRKHGRPTSLRQLAPVVFLAALVLGGVAAPFHDACLTAYLVGVAAYAITSVLFSSRAAAHAGWDLLPLLPLVFLVFHVSYGIGFAAGLIDFVLLRRPGRSRMTTLTRS